MKAAESVVARLATLADEPFLRQLFYVVRAPEFAPAGLTPEQLDQLLAQQYQAMRTYYAQVFPDAEYLILEADGMSIGYEALRTTSELHLIDIALMPEYRNLGIGTYRMRRLQDLAARAGKALTLSVEVFNPAKALYDRLGFTIEETQGIYHRMQWSSGDPGP